MNPFPFFQIRRLRRVFFFLVPVLAQMLIIGCLFQSETPDRSISLFLPLPDTSAEGVWSGVDGRRQLAQEAIINEGGKRVQYRVDYQDVGSWNAEREWYLNHFLLQTNYLFIEELFELSFSPPGTEEMYGKLSDPYTVYYDSTKAADFLQQITTTTVNGVIGVLIEYVPTGDTVRVRYVVPGSPAESAGLLKGDRIVRVNDSAVTGPEAPALFTENTAGDSGTVLDIRLVREGLEMQATIVKGIVDFPTVLTDTLNGFGYIQVFEFKQKSINGLTTHSEFQQALEATASFPVTLLDLRKNPGGSVSEVLEMCDDIVSDGVLIQEESRYLDVNRLLPTQEKVTHRAERTGPGEGRRYVLLADSGSASASEIFLSCLMEGEGVPFVGRRSFGKGIGQILFPTPARGLAKITITQFLSRSDASYNGGGIAPTHDVPDSLILERGLSLAEEIAGTITTKRSPGQRRRIAQALEWNRRQFLRKSAEPEYMQVPKDRFPGADN